MHEGHRQRMLQRLAAGDTLQDHELLEILLFYAIPRKNTNEIAHALIDCCGGLESVFRADIPVLLEVDGIGPQSAAYIRAVGAVYERFLLSDDREKHSLPFSFGVFRDRIKERFAPLTNEVLELYCIDAKDKVSFYASYTSDETDHVEVHPEDITRFLAQHRPSGLAVAHNHPGTSCKPSIQDDDFTKKVYLLCALNHVRFLDHIVVGNDAVFSYHLSGRLGDIADRCDIDKMIQRPLPTW